MERHSGRTTTDLRGGFDAPALDRHAGESRRALITCALAMYPLIGSATIILAAILLAGGHSA